MASIFDLTIKSRQFLLTLVEGVAHEDLFKIPAGFNNNIWWNLAHLVATEQLLCYKLGGEAMLLEDDLFNAFRTDTKPDGTQVSPEEVAQVKKWLIETISQTETDHKAGKFKNYRAYTTSAGVTLSNIDEALAYSFYHDGIHTGSILALKRALGLVG